MTNEKSKVQNRESDATRQHLLARREENTEEQKLEAGE